MTDESSSTVGRNPSEGLVTENIKTLRILHQLLMVVSAGILAFALRPDHSNDYKSALDELAIIKQVSYGGWSNYVAHRYKAETDRDVKFILNVIHQAGISIKGAPSVVIPVFGDQVPFFSNSRLLDLETFFTKTQRIGFMKFVTTRQPLLEQLAKWKSGRNPNVQLIALNVSANSGLQYQDGSPMLDWLNRSFSATSSVPIYMLTDEQGIQTTYVTFTYSPSTETGQFALEWLRNDTFGKQLIDPVSGVVFPSLKVFWHQINQDEPDQAIVFLQEESAANSRGTLSFFGIPVERSLAISAGPVVCFSILLFLCLHLRHFRSMVSSNDTIIFFPWVPLFRSIWGEIVTIMTILVLPTIAIAVLLKRLGDWRELSTQIGLTFGAGVIGLGLWAFYEIHELRKKSFQ
jgi:hypothetical protein